MIRARALDMNHIASNPPVKCFASPYYFAQSTRMKYLPLGIFTFIELNSRKNSI